MRLLMISGDRSVLEGKQSAFYYMLQEFHKHWERIDIICPRPSEHVAQRLPSNVYFHPSPWGLHRQAFWIRERGKTLIAQYRHHIMTVHAYPPFYNSKGAIALHRKTGIPFVLEVHHIVGWPQAADFKELIGRLLSRLVLPLRARRAAMVRVVNATVGEVLEGWGVPSTKIALVPSFYLDRNTLRSDIAPPKSYDIVVCSRLVANKGIDRVIEVLRILPDARLLVIGDGPLRGKLEKSIDAYGMSNRVTFLGWLPTLNAVFGAVLTARIFVMPSLSEGGPRSALEAMGIGMPVIATKVGVMPDVIEDGVNGFLTDGTPTDIAEKVSILLNDPNMRGDMGKRAQGIIERFERIRLIEQYAEFLKQIVH